MVNEIWSKRLPLNVGRRELTRSVNESLPSSCAYAARAAVNVLLSEPISKRVSFVIGARVSREAPPELQN